VIRHHPDDALLLAFAAGRLGAGPALVLGVHLDGCAACRGRLQPLLALGGALVEQSEPLALAPAAWAQTLERIDAAPAPAPAPAPAAQPPALPGGLPWPARLRATRASRWHWMGPGMRFARLTLPAQPEAKLFLLRIGPGRSLPRHSHDGLELTQVLCGRFDDGRASFGAGDFDATDDEVLHQPVVRPGAECVCLAYVASRLRFEGRIASVIGGWVGL